MLMEPLLPRPTDPVSQPIINSPYHPPQYHWNLDSSTKAWPLRWTADARPRTSRRWTVLES